MQKLYLYLSLILPAFILTGCGGGSGNNTIITPVNYSFAVGNNGIVYSYAAPNSLSGSPTILPYLGSAALSGNNLSPAWSTSALIAPDYSQGTVNIWRNAGNGVYAGPTQIWNGLTSPWGITGTDLNRDGITDVIVQDSVKILTLQMDALGNVVGSATLPAPALFSPNLIAPIDINKDGAPDLVTVGNNYVNPTVIGVNMGYTVSVQIYMNNGVGGFTAQPLLTCSESPMNNGAATLQITGRPATGDLDGDGFPELVVGSFASSTVHKQSPVFVFANTNGAIYGSCFPLKDNGIGLHPSGVNIADMNADGKMDIVVGNFIGNSVAIYPGNGTINGFGTSIPINLPTSGSHINGIDLGDLNGDGKIDIAAANANSSVPSVELLFNQGGMFFLNQTLHAGVAPLPVSNLIRTQYNPGTYPIDVRIRDVNADGKLDILTANQNFTNGNGATPTSSFSVVLQK